MDNSLILKLINSFYNILSGKASDKRDWPSFRLLFCQSAQLISLNNLVNYSEESLKFDVESYIISMKDFLSKEDFFEHSVSCKILIEANIAQVFNVYEAFHSSNGIKNTNRGINMIHLHKEKDEWKILSMIWHDIPLN